MVSDHTFISYSRKQLYFAEALTLHLQKQGTQCWFDLQQLEAGADWAKELQDGYSTCKRLVLVASRASFASPYVSVEWETALKNGGEVILVVFEEVDIPEKLKGAAVFDFRGNFNLKLRQLLAYLNGGTANHDPIPKPNRFNIPKRMPLDIWLMLVNMTLPALWVIIIPLLITPSLFSSSMATGIYSALVLVAIWNIYTTPLRFLLHELDHDRLREVTVWVMVIQLLQVFLSAILLSNSALPIINRIAMLSALFSIYVYFVPLNRSAALLRWFSSGDATQKLRRNIHAPLLGEDAHAESIRNHIDGKPVPTSFFIHHSPADMPLAKMIENILAKHGHSKAASAEGATRHILLVTNRTSKKMAAEIGGQYGKDAFYILGSPVDMDESLSKAGQFQWVDFRKNNKKNIEGLGQSLGDIQAWDRETALEVAPTRFQDLKSPGTIQLLSIFVAGMVASMFDMNLLIFWGWNGLFNQIAFLVGGAAMYWATERMLLRKISITAYVGTLLGVFIFIMIATQQRLTNLFFISVMAAYAYRWFPTGEKPAPDEIGMDADGKIRRRMRIMTATFTVGSTLFFVFVKYMLPTMQAMAK